MDKKKILFIDAPIYPPGGGQFSLLLTLQYLNKNKFAPLVFIPYKNIFTKWLKEKNISYKIIPLKDLFFSIRSANPSIIHCNLSTTKYTFWSALISKFLGIPFIWHVRVTGSAGWRDKVIANLSTKIIVISDAVKEKFNWVANRNKIKKIHNAVDTKVFRPGLDIKSLYNEFAIEKNKKIVGIFSRLDPLKGHTLFFDSAKIIKDNIPNSLFLVVGEGVKEYRNKLINYIEELGLKNDFIFTGYRKDIPQLMNLCDVIVNPSIESESFGRTIIEAMACGKPVVATNVGAIPEIIEHGVTGLLVSPKDPHSLADAIHRLLNYKNKKREMGNRERERVKRFFSVEGYISQIEEIYEELLCQDM